MNNIKVSILVPICNVEKYLDKCLHSIIDQKLEDIEIICINDGSKDKSLEIIKKFAKGDKRIVIIDKVNTGYGDSMNCGLNIARGKYIGIVESDDFVAKDMFFDLYQVASDNDADLVKSNYYLYWDNPKKTLYCNNLCVKTKITGEHARERIFWGSSAIWSAIYKREWLHDNNIKFLTTPGASYQDTSFNFKVASLAKNIVITPKAYLRYRQDNANSSVKNASMEKVYLLHKEWEEVKTFIKDNNLSVFDRFYETLKFDGYMWNYSRISKADRSEYFKILYKNFSNNKFKNDVVSDYIPKYCRYGGMFAIRNNLPWLLELIMFLRELKQK